MRRSIKLVGSDVLHVEYSGEGEVILNMEVNDMHRVTAVMADMKEALLRDDVRPVVARSIIEGMYRVIDQDVIGDIIKQHLETRDA